MRSKHLEMRAKKLSDLYFKTEGVFILYSVVPGTANCYECIVTFTAVVERFIRAVKNGVN